MVVRIGILQSAAIQKLRTPSYEGKRLTVMRPETARRRRGQALADAACAFRSRTLIRKAAAVKHVLE